jgi:hypothetical protein
VVESADVKTVSAYLLRLNSRIMDGEWRAILSALSQMLPWRPSRVIPLVVRLLCDRSESE